MPRVTALRALRPGRVAVELDGALWRTLPLEVVVRAGLRVDEGLDRPRLRLLRRELRRHETLAAAGRALRNRDHSARELDRKLEQRGASAAERLGALETLERAGLVDDERFAARRAQALADRGWGDAAIRVDLEGRDVATELVEQALSTLEPERERAAALAERRGGGVRAARWLAARGFDADALEGVIANEGGAALP
ncbi:MAG TPA: RecX family transcriptional regulator [Gaiellaceae bacterium]